MPTGSATRLAGGSGREAAQDLQSTKTEQAVLGSILIDASVWPRVAALVSETDFTRPDHRMIFCAMTELSGAGRAIDVISVADHLADHLGDRLEAAGGIAYLGKLARDTGTAVNVITYAAAVRERGSLRLVERLAREILDAVNDADGRSVADLLADTQAQLQRLQSRARQVKGLVDAGRLVADLNDDLDARAIGKVGLNVGLPDFDSLTCGLEPGDLVVIAARPGMGKTAFLVSLAGTLSHHIGVAVFSAEMPSMQLMRRAIALQSNVPQGRLRHAERLTDEDWGQIAAASTSIAVRKLWIDDTASPTLAHIRSESFALKAREKLGLVLVDYLQLVRGNGANRYEELRQVAYGLKALAKELAVPIIALAQLNRGVEAREQKRPSASDLRDSGAIEEAADIVGLLYSEGYYDPAFQMAYVLECQIAKNRNGERGRCLWRFDGDKSRITPLDDAASAEYRRIQATRQQPRGSNL